MPRPLRSGRVSSANRYRKSQVAEHLRAALDATEGPARLDTNAGSIDAG
jgi:hypothetical protein